MQRTAVVTGGAGGIGGAIVRSLAATGHDLAILDREGEFAVESRRRRLDFSLSGRF